MLQAPVERLLVLQDAEVGWAVVPTHPLLPNTADRETMEPLKLPALEGQVGSCPGKLNIDMIVELGFDSACFRRIPTELVADTLAAHRALGWELVEQGGPRSP